MQQQTIIVIIYTHNQKTNNLDTKNIKQTYKNSKTTNNTDNDNKHSHKSKEQTIRKNKQQKIVKHQKIHNNNHTI